MADPTRPEGQGEPGEHATPAIGPPMPQDDEVTNPDEPHGGAEGQPDHPVGQAALDHLAAEVTNLRLRLEDEVRTRRVTVIDDADVARMRFATTPEGHSEIALLTPDGFERLKLMARADGGSLSISCRPHSGKATVVAIIALDPEEDAGDSNATGEPTLIEVLALDPQDKSDDPNVAVELIDRGNIVGGISLYEGQAPRAWTDPQ